MKTRFYLCKKSKVVFHSCIDNCEKMLCSDDQLTELVPNISDANEEKHLPVININSDFITVSVGSVIHPMDDNHYISFIYLETEKSGQIKYLNPGDKPIVTFFIKNDKPTAVYEYCTLHGLWKTDII